MSARAATVTDLQARRRRPLARGEWAVIVTGCLCGMQHVVDLTDVLADPGNVTAMPCGRRIEVRMRNLPGMPW